MNINECIRNNIIFLRNQAKLSQKDFAAICNKSRSVCSKWESGAVVPKLNEIRDICNYFKCDIGAFVTRQLGNDDINDEKICYGEIYVKENMRKKRALLNKSRQDMMRTLISKEDVGESQSTYASMEKRNTYPYVGYIVDIAKILSVDFVDLVFGLPSEWEGLNAAHYDAVHGAINNLKIYFIQHNVIEYEEMTDIFFELTDLEKKLIENARLSRTEKDQVSNFELLWNEMYVDETVICETRLRSIAIIEYYSNCCGIECEKLFRPIIDELLLKISKNNRDKAIYYEALFLINGVKFGDYDFDELDGERFTDGVYYMADLYHRENQYAVNWIEERLFDDNIMEVVEEVGRKKTKWKEIIRDEDTLIKYCEEERKKIEERIHIWEDVWNGKCTITDVMKKLGIEDSSSDEDDAYQEYVPYEEVWDKANMDYNRHSHMENVLNELVENNCDIGSRLVCDDDGYVMGTEKNRYKYCVYIKRKQDSITVHFKEFCKKDTEMIPVARLEHENWEFCKTCCFGRTKVHDKADKKGYSINLKDKSTLIPNWMIGLKEKLDNALNAEDVTE